MIERFTSPAVADPLVVVIQIELVRMRPQAHRIELLLALPRRSRSRSRSVGEDAAACQERVVLLRAR